MGGEGEKSMPLFKHWPALSYELTVKRETSLTESWNLGHLIHISRLHLSTINAIHRC